jgi:hypothetical protein
VRHERFATTLLLSVLAVFVSAAGCNGDKSAPTPKTNVGTTAGTSIGTQSIRLDTDTVSGCVSGAPLVKILIELKPSADRCAPEVTPASVCVAPAGVVRFRVHNRCGDLGKPDRPALEITQPAFKRALFGTETWTGGGLFQNCSLKVPQIAAGASQIILCDIAADALDGFYKYGLEGDIVPVDPDVEVRRGH